MNVETTTMPTGFAARRSRVNPFSNCKVDKLNVVTLRAALDGYKQAWTEDATAEELSVALTSYYADHFDVKTFPKCDICGGSSDDNLEVCPFCGLDNEPPVTETAADTKASDDGTSIDATALPPEVYQEEPKRKRGRPKKEKVDAAPMVLAGYEKPLDSPVDTADLDENVKQILALKKDEAGSKWKIGQLINENGKRRLWTTRTVQEKDGFKGAYKTFDAFCHNELFMSPTYARLLVDVATHFTEQQVREWGVRKLTPTLQLPEPERTLLLESKIKERGYASAVSEREVEREVREIKKEKGIKSRPARDGTARGGDKTAAAPKAGLVKVTVANMLGKQTVKLFCKPAKISTFDPKTARRARKMSDQPWGQLELVNDVKQYFSVAEVNGDLLLTVVTKRVNEKDD